MNLNPNKTPVKIMNGFNLVDKSGVLWKKFFFDIYKMGEGTNLTYYQKSKERLRQ